MCSPCDEIDVKIKGFHVIVRRILKSADARHIADLTKELEAEKTAR